MKIVRSTLLLAAALLAFLAIGVDTANAQPSPMGTHVFPKATQLPKLAVGQHYGIKVVGTPDGPVIVEYGDSSTAPKLDFSKKSGARTVEIIGENATLPAGVDAQPNSADVAASTTYVRSCWASATSVAWRIRLDSTFQYNFSTLWQQPPRLGVTSFLPYSWSDLADWNSYWTYTVRFADGRGVLHAGIWGFGMAVTYNLSIQEDAWGNCTPNIWRS